MARAVRLSASQLEKIFKIQAETSPQHYLRDLRLEESRRLLENDFLRVKEIAALVGLPDQSHFVRDFKKKYGCTPTEYRRRCWRESQSENEK